MPPSKGRGADGKEDVRRDRYLRDLHALACGPVEERGGGQPGAVAEHSPQVRGRSGGRGDGSGRAGGERGAVGGGGAPVGPGAGGPAGAAGGGGGRSWEPGVSRGAARRG